MSSDLLDMRLRQYVPAGAAGPVIPTQSMDWTAPLGDVATLNFTVSETFAGAIPDVCEFAVEIFDGNTWKEPRGGRFMNQRAAGDDLDQSGIKNFTTVSFVHWMMAKAEFQTATGEDQEFDTTAGAILRTMFDAAQGRGWGKFINTTFTATTDSAGKAWNDTARVEMSFRDGTVLSQALQTLADQGVLEYATEGRTLHVYNTGHGTDISGGSERSTVGSKVREMPVEVTNEDLLTNVTVRGDDNRWNFPVQGGLTSLGRLEGSVQASGVTKQTQAVRFAELLQTTGKAPRTQYTLSEAAPTMDARPFINYDLGDWVSARRPGGWERMRVTEVQLHRDADAAITADITLVDRLTDLAARLAKRNAALGAKLAGNGYMTDRITPAAIKDILDGIGGFPGMPGGGMPVTPKPEYGSAWPDGGANFQWGSEGSDPNATPDYVDTTFNVSKLRRIPLPADVQNEGNLVFALDVPENFGILWGVATTADGVKELAPATGPILDPKDEDKDEDKDKDLPGWIPDGPDHDEIEDPIDKPPVEQPELPEEEDTPPQAPEGTIPMASWGHVQILSGYLYAGDVYDWGHHTTGEVTAEVGAKVIRGSNAFVAPPAYEWSRNGMTYASSYQLSYAKISIERKPFSSMGWLYIPLAVEIGWLAPDTEGSALSYITKSSLRFVRSKITDHLTLGKLEAVEKAELPIEGVTNGNSRDGDLTSTTRAGNQILISVLQVGSRARTLHCAAFTQAGEIAEEKFSNAIPPMTNGEYDTHSVIAKSLDGSGMSLFGMSGQELLLADGNARRRDEDTVWTTPAELPARHFGVASGRVVTVDITHASEDARAGVLGADGVIRWGDHPQETDNDPYQKMQLAFSYGGYVYGRFNTYGYSMKLTPA